jgi:hypothetical protein
MPFDGRDFESTSPVTHMLVAGRRKIQAGWCQQRMRQPGSVCMIGSLPITDFESFNQAERLFLDAIRLLGYASASVPSFNDDPGRTQSQVLTVFDKAIELSEAAA